ncbi:MAG: LbtU family siderophore porin [Halothiobacillaceae bacterium]
MFKRTDYRWPLAALFVLSSPNWAMAAQDDSYPRVSFGGLLEVEAYHASPYVGDSERDIKLSTAELSMEAEVTPWLTGFVSALYEQDDTPLEIDTAEIAMSTPDGPWSLRAGQIYLPFGAYETVMVSDPLTLELGETRQTAVVGGYAQGGIDLSAYVFSGDLESGDNIGNWGLRAGWVGEPFAGSELALSAGYLNSLGESDGLEGGIQDAGAGNTSRVAAWTANAVFIFNDFLFVGEYLSALDDFDATAISYRNQGARPAAWNLEGSYGFDMMGMPVRAGIGYQGSQESIALELPEQRLLGSITFEMHDHAALSFEYAHDTDYGTSEGGTGKNAGTFTALLAVSF